MCSLSPKATYSNPYQNYSGLWRRYGHLIPKVAYSKQANYF